MSNDRRIHREFEQLAARQPEAIALVVGELQVRYGELNERANGIAAAVQRLQPEQHLPLAILAGHEFEAIVAALGVLKSGRAYCHLISSSADEELAFMLEDLQAPLILTGAAHAARAQAIAGSEQEVLVLEAVSPAAGNPSAVATGDEAGIYYTSGSTGRPKGVIRTHSTILNRLEIDRSLYRVGPGDQVALLRSLSFGSGCAVLYNGILNGATVHLAEPGTMTPHEAARWLLERRVSVLNIMNSLLRNILDVLEDDLVFEDLRYIRPSARTTPEDINRLWRHLPQQCLVGHGLGSTEFSLAVHTFVYPGQFDGSEVIPLGRPVEGVAVTLVDVAGKPVLDGEAGEIVISSTCVTPGYWRRPELTAAKITDGGGDGLNTIRTGDLGRWRADGLLEFSGRSDRQVKIRGYRLELDAVEIALEELPGVAQAAAVAFAEEDGEAILVGYVEPEAGAKLSGPVLRRLLAESAPAHFVPSRLVVLERLPLGPSGKVEQSALPRTLRLRPELETPYVAPRTELERTIGDIWTEVLQIEGIGIHDSFFDLGGESLNAGMVMVRVRQRLGIDLTFAALMTAGTVAAMAAIVEEAAAPDSTPTPEEIRFLLGL